MPQMSLAELLTHVPHPSSRVHGRSNRSWLVAFALLTLAGALGVTATVALAVEAWTPAAWLALVLVGLGSIWICGGAATALLGLLQPPSPPLTAPAGWRPTSQTAILVLICGEPPAPVAAYLAALQRALDALGMAQATHIFVLSDTRAPDAIAAEEAALAPLHAAQRITYRRRTENTGRKPGNIAQWLEMHADGFDHMLVLDADSRMSADRIRGMIHRMDGQPHLGLLQAGMRCCRGAASLAGTSGSPRSCSPRISGVASRHGRAMRAITGATTRSCVSMPSVPPRTCRCCRGGAPFGGPPLSHDFVEAAWIRRAGWAVALDPATAGSAEDGPQTLAEFHKRDRRWCQGNLQHIRLIAAPGLDPVSRVHLASGIASYIAAPVWLSLVLLMASGAVQVTAVLPLLLVAGILLIPKLCAVGQWLWRTRSPVRRAVLLRASLGELALSSLVAPLVMVRQTGAVLSVIAGQDCGWKSLRAARIRLPHGLPEATVGAALMGLAALAGAPATALWLLPVALPLLGAPWLHRHLAKGSAGTGAERGAPA